MTENLPYKKIVVLTIMVTALTHGFQNFLNNGLAIASTSEEVKVKVLHGFDH